MGPWRLTRPLSEIGLPPAITMFFRTAISTTSWPEISIIDIQFARLTRFDTQFACLSKFNILHANSFDLGFFSLFSQFFSF